MHARWSSVDAAPCWDGWMNVPYLQSGPLVWRSRSFPLKHAQHAFAGCRKWWEGCNGLSRYSWHWAICFMVTGEVRFGSVYTLHSTFTITWVGSVIIHSTRTMPHIQWFCNKSHIMLQLFSGRVCFKTEHFWGVTTSTMTFCTHTHITQRVNILTVRYVPLSNSLWT